MKNPKKSVKFINIGAVTVALLGLVQIILYLFNQISIIQNALKGGTTSTVVVEHILNFVLPQVITYLIVPFGIAAILFVCGLILKYLSDCCGDTCSCNCDCDSDITDADVSFATSEEDETDIDTESDIEQPEPVEGIDEEETE